MANQRTRGRSAPRRALIGPLVMLASGMVAGVVLWRVLMDEPPRATGIGVGASEQLSHQDRRALDHLLTEHRAHQ
jgi:uncharacterized membrane protein